MRYKQAGSTVILSMIIILVLAMCVGGALDYTLQTYRDAQQSNARNQAIAAATGAVDLAFVQWRQACRAQENVILTASSITTGSSWSPYTSYSALTGSSSLKGAFMNIPGDTTPVQVSLSAMDVTDVNSISDAIASFSGSSTIQTPVPSQAQSQTMPSFSYLAKATASYQSLKGTQTVSVYRVFQKVTETPWQFAIFYNNDLEINPGATMNITGSVQTNGSLYTGGSDGTNYLNFSSGVHYAKSWNPNGAFSPTDTANSGETAVPPTGTIPSPGPTQQPQNASLLTTASTNPNLSDGYHEIIEPPVSGYTDPLAGTSTSPSERYYNQAGVKIMITGSKSSPVVTLYDGAENVVTSGTSQSTVDQNIYKAFNPAISTSSTLQDARQNASINLTTLDISKITSALNGSLYQTSTGVSTGNGGNAAYASTIYIDDERTGLNPGVELINGYNMPSGGLTVVSNNPVYIQGDYNTSTSTADISNVPSNKSTSNPLLPYAPDYTPQSCAVMADAVTILSNAWTNSNSTNGLSSRNASNTTVNAALLSGIVSSGSGFTYTGGVENFPRFLENWTDKYFTYYGSMVELFQSMQGTGVFQEPGAYYNPPHRQWYFNVNFYQTPPPGTFTVIDYVKSRYFIQ